MSGAQEKVLTLWCTDDGFVSVNNADGNQVALIETDFNSDLGVAVTAGLVGELTKKLVREHLEETRSVCP